MERWIKILDRKILDRRSYAILIACVLSGLGAYFLYKILTLCALGLLVIFLTNEARFTLKSKNGSLYAYDNTKLHHKIIFTIGWILFLIGALLCVFDVFLEEFLKIAKV